MAESSLTDKEVIQSLKDLDCDTYIDTTEWETDFLDSILSHPERGLTVKQREAALRMLEKYDFL